MGLKWVRNGSDIDLIDKEIEIWNGFEWTLVTPRKTGSDQTLLKMSFSPKITG